MDKKVIEPVVIKQEAEDNIRIEKRSTRTCISQIEVCGWKENKVSVDDATRTEVAKAICPKYQKVIDALNTLVQLKDIKDIPEMNEHYKTMKPKAWQQAREILKELNV